MISFLDNKSGQNPLILQIHTAKRCEDAALVNKRKQETKTEEGYTSHQRIEMKGLRTLSVDPTTSDNSTHNLVLQQMRISTTTADTGNSLWDWAWSLLRIPITRIAPSAKEWKINTAVENRIRIF